MQETHRFRHALTFAEFREALRHEERGATSDDGHPLTTLRKGITNTFGETELRGPRPRRWLIINLS